jgi:IS605 OrfB family transposase
MDVVAFTVELDELDAKGVAGVVETRAESLNVLCPENLPSPLGYENQMDMQSENAIAVPIISQDEIPLVVRTLKLRVKSGSVKWLRQQARETNGVWNYCNELSAKHFDRKREFMSAFDMQKLLAGYGKAGGELGSTTVQQVAEEYCIRRRQFKKVKLRWRKSRGARRSLGWVPFKQGAAKWKDTHIRFNGRKVYVWDSYGLAQHHLRAGSFSEDSRGRWYLNVCVKVEAKAHQSKGSVGIDLGLKSLAAFSTGEVIPANKEYRRIEAELAIQQRAGNRQRVKAIHAKAKNRRKDSLHKLSTRLVDGNSLIVVGDVSSAKLVKTKMAKSVLDAGWSTLKTMLEYKAIGRPVRVEVVSEKLSSQTCSDCGSLPHSRPRGIAGLGIREWTCSDCGAQHDRDVNAAKNILRVGLEQLASAA